jgi:hypothetical protein
MSTTTRLSTREGESEARIGVQFKQISNVVRILALHVYLSELCGGRGTSDSVVVVVKK